MGEQSATYRPSGQKFSRHGRKFQLQLLMVFLNRGCKKGYKFSLATEIEGAKAFDDVLFKYKDENDDIVYRFVQAKHKLDEHGARIKYVDLLGASKEEKKGDFHLLKYFESFLQIRENGTPDGKFPKLKLKDLVIYTNIGIDFDDLKSCGITLKKLDDKDDILDDKTIEGKIPERFRFADFPNDKKEMFHRQSDVTHQLAKTLANRVCTGRSIDFTNENLKKFQKALVMENIIDPGTKKLHENFIRNEGLSSNAKEFRRTFFEGIKQGATTSDHFLNEILSLAKDFGKSEEHLDEKLPTDQVNDELIEEYFKHLVLAVNQPNSKQLDNIIEEEIRQQFNIHDSGLITDALYFYMWEWMTESHGRYLSATELRDFYEKAKKRMKKLSIVGVKSDNREKSLKFGDFFEDISSMEMHLNSVEPVINIISPKSTALTFIKVAQVLQNFPLDGYAAVGVSFLLSNEEKYLSAFDFDESFTLVIELSAINDMKENDLNKLLQKIFLKIKPEHKQKLVLISSSENCGEYSSNTLSFKNITDQTAFSDLTAEAQSRILSKEILLQDCKCILKDLLNGITDHLTDDMIDMVINEEDVNITNKVDDLGDINNYYIERKFKKYLKYSTDFFNQNVQSLGDAFAIIGTNKSELMLLMPNEKVCNFGDNDYVNKLSRIIVVQNYAQYNALCQHYQPQTNIIFLAKEEDGFIWLASTGILDHYNEDELLFKKHNNKLIVIAAERNTGRSTVLKHLAMSLKKKKSHYWVLLINLKDFTTILNDGEFTTPDSMLSFIIETQQLKNQFQKDLLYALIMDSGNVALFVDEFDGSQTYKSKVVSMLKYLETTKISMIFVSAEYQYAKEIESQLNLHAYQKLSLSIQDYAQFLKKIWKRNLKLGDDNDVETRLDLFVNSLVTSFAESANLLTSILLKNPLHAQMIADVYQGHLREHLECVEPKLNLDLKMIAGPNMALPFIPIPRLRCNTGFDVLELYRVFVKNKIEMSLRDNMRLENTKMKCIFEEIIRPRICEMHENVALRLVFPEHVSSVFKVEREFPSIAMEDVALVQKLNDEYYFKHQTFAPYFAAEKIAKCIKKHSKDSKKHKCITEFLSSILFLPSNTLIRVFLDSALAHNSEIHLAVRNRNVDHFKDILSRDPEGIHCCDAIGRTPLHYACMNNAVDIAKFIIDKDASCISTLDAFKFGPVFYASLNPHPQMLEMLFKVRTNDKGFEVSLKGVMSLFDVNCQSYPSNQMLAKYISAYANDEQKYLIVKSINYKEVFMETMKSSNYKRFPTFFTSAAKAQQKEMLIQNDYVIVKTILEKNPVDLWSISHNCIDEEMKEHICQLEEYKTKFKLLLKSDLNQLWFLVKLANRKNLEILWGKKGYIKYFKACANASRSDMMYELMQLFKGENLFQYLGQEFLDYFEKLFSKKQAYWAGKLFECTNSEQRKQLFKSSNWLRELDSALQTNDWLTFHWLLNCVTQKSLREKLFNDVNYVKAFKTAIDANDLPKLIVLSFCNDDECKQLTDSIQDESVYHQLFKNNLDKMQSLFLLTHYTSREEREEVFNLAQCPSYVREVVECREQIPIEKDGDHYKRVLEALCPNAIGEEIGGKKWSIWGRLLYVLCKHVKTVPSIKVSMEMEIQFELTN